MPDDPTATYYQWLIVHECYLHTGDEWFLKRARCLWARLVEIGRSRC